MAILILAEKITKVRMLIEQLLGGGATVEKGALRSLMGLISCVANLCPQVSPFTAMLWAAEFIKARCESGLLSADFNAPSMVVSIHQRSAGPIREALPRPSRDGYDSDL